MNLIRLLAALFVLLLTINGGRSIADERTATSQRQFFEAKIRPVLVQHCYECHSADSKEIGGNFRIDSRDGMLAGGESGPSLLAGRPDESLVIQALRYDGLEMPPEEPLPAQVINDFAEWIAKGAYDPRETETTHQSAADGGTTADPEELWSFVPRTQPAIPSVHDRWWPIDSIDCFVLAGIEQAGLQPTTDADAATLARRLYYDLIGLPPTSAQLHAFSTEYELDPVAAKTELVDRLLASPQFGVRWGRYWLDVARYGESNGDDGLGRNATFPQAWRYRDYVIDALNNDVPYDQFLTEQIAGDSLPAETAQQRNRQLIATGFLAIGSKPAAAMNNNFAMDVVDDQINTVCTTVLGLSVACARCHDHKHDPIPTRDYYALAGIFQSTETLYGASGNEKLTAPPTPLHELYDSLEQIQIRPDRSSPPNFPREYSDAIDALKPSLHESLKVAPERLTVSPPASHSVDRFAAVKDTRLTGQFEQDAESYSLSFWFLNSIKNDERPITAYLFSRAKLDDKSLPGDHLGIGGNHEKDQTGKLFVFNGNEKKQTITGSTVIDPNSWNHIVLVRSGKRVNVFLNGQLEIDGDLEPAFGDSRQYCLAGRSDQFAPLAGNIGEVAIFDRGLANDEARQLHAASGQPLGIRPRPPLGFAMGVRDRSNPADCKIHINGDGKKLGPDVPRGVLTAYRNVSTTPSTLGEISIQSGTSGRAALANWLTRADHPQTARVMVNRVWLHLMGQGIVDTPDDFGVYGARPSHPELLDHLANRFVQDGWSVKRLIRTIVLSRTYSMDSCTNPAALQSDPDNHWMARHNRRRLDAESLRDSMLLVCGNLDYSPDHGSAIENLDMLINWPPGEATNLHRDSQHRSVYLCMLRHAPPRELAAFDLPDAVAIAGKRESTTLPTQALFLINSDFVVDNSRTLVERLLPESIQDSMPDDRERVSQLFASVLSRRATPAEIDRAVGYLRLTRQQLADSGMTPEQCRMQSWASLAQALMTTNEFRYVD
ncbi:MAG: DUF1553 domain-containing protein [Planctomycetales bacterium]|nr:DUF1553 domain-containing protein [Planctomycetales bacterium]